MQDWYHDMQFLVRITILYWTVFLKPPQTFLLMCFSTRFLLILERFSSHNQSLPNQWKLWNNCVVVSFLIRSLYRDQIWARDASKTCMIDYRKWISRVHCVLLPEHKVIHLRSLSRAQVSISMFNQLVSIIQNSLRFMVYQSQNIIPASVSTANFANKRRWG